MENGRSIAQLCADQIRTEYGERLDSHGKDSANEWLLSRAETLFQKATNRTKPCEAVAAFETLMELAEM